MTDKERLGLSLSDMVIDRDDVDPDRTVLMVAGEIDVCTAPQLREQLMAVHARVVVVNLTQVSFMDARGLVVLIEYRRKCFRENRELLLVFDGRPVLRVFGILGLHKAFRIFDDQAAALAAA